MVTSLSNERVKRVRALQTQRQTREKEKRFVVEGVRLVEEALRTQLEFEFVLYEKTTEARPQKLLDELAQRRVNVIQVSPEIMRAAADTEHPQPVLGVLPFPVFTSPPASPTLILIADRLSDPGNLGTLLRSAAAAGVEAVLLSPETVDAFNPKVVRAGMGAHFRLPLASVTWAEIKDRTQSLRVRLAEMTQATRYDQVDWTQPGALIISSEAEGASAEAQALAIERVYIPMQKEVESLNAAVAGSVILFEIARQRAASR